MTTAGELVTTIRQRTDMVKSQFVTNTELLSWLNSSLAELYDVITTTYEDYAVESETATISSSSSPFFELPETFYKLRGVDLSVGSCYRTLRQYSFHERNNGCDDLRYRVQGENIYITPEQSSAGTYRVWFVPRWENLADDDDLPALMNLQAWSEYGVADVGAKVLQKQDMDPSVFLAQKAALQNRILSAAKNRDAGGVKKVVDTRRMRDLSRTWGRGW